MPHSDNFIDLRETLDYANLHFEYDAHLTSEGYVVVADAIQTRLAEKLGQNVQ